MKRWIVLGTVTLALLVVATIAIRMVASCGCTSEEPCVPGHEAECYFHRLKSPPRAQGWVFSGDAMPGEFEIARLRLLGPQALPVVPQMLEEIRNDTQWAPELARVFASVGPVTDEVIPSLCGSLEKTSSSTQEAIAWALGEMGPAASSAADALVKALSSTSGQVRQEAAHALVKIGKRAKEAVPELLVEMHRQGGDPEIAVMMLGRIGPDASAALSDLKWMMGYGPKPSTRLNVYALVSVARIQGKTDAAVTELIGLLEDGDASREAAWSAAEVLGTLGPDADRAIPVLARSFLKPGASREIREAIAKAFCDLGTGRPEAVAALKVGCSDPQEYVRIYCERALEKLAHARDAGPSTTHPTSVP